jgi:hypothetical protein
MDTMTGTHGLAFVGQSSLKPLMRKRELLFYVVQLIPL